MIEFNTIFRKCQEVFSIITCTHGAIHDSMVRAIKCTMDTFLDFLQINLWLQKTRKALSQGAKSSDKRLVVEIV